MRPIFACLIVSLSLSVTSAWPRSLRAQNRVASLEFHAWARFGDGSWKLVRVHKETLDETGQVTSASSTDVRTTLIDLGDDQYTRRVETTVEVAGKRFRSEPTDIAQGLHGEAPGQTVSCERTGTGEVVICGRTYPTEIQQIVVNGDGIKRSNTVHYSKSVPPYVLRRVTKATDAEGSVLYDSTVQVLAIDMPCRVLMQVKKVCYIKTVQHYLNGSSTIALEIHCDDVPGGVVSHSWKELDADGKVVSRSTLELTDYKVVSPTKNGAPEETEKKIIIKPRLIDRLRAYRNR